MRLWFIPRPLLMSFFKNPSSAVCALFLFTLVTVGAADVRKGSEVDQFWVEGGDWEYDFRGSTLEKSVGKGDIRFGRGAITGTCKILIITEGGRQVTAKEEVIIKQGAYTLKTSLLKYEHTKGLIRVPGLFSIFEEGTDRSIEAENLEYDLERRKAHCTEVLFTDLTMMNGLKVRSKSLTYKEPEAMNQEAMLTVSGNVICEAGEGEYLKSESLEYFPDSDRAKIESSFEAKLLLARSSPIIRPGGEYVTVIGVSGTMSGLKTERVALDFDKPDFRSEKEKISGDSFNGVVLNGNLTGRMEGNVRGKILSQEDGKSYSFSSSSMDIDMAGGMFLFEGDVLVTSEGLSFTSSRILITKTVKGYRVVSETRSRLNFERGLFKSRVPGS